MWGGVVHEARGWAAAFFRQTEVMGFGDGEEQIENFESWLANAADEEPDEDWNYYDPDIAYDAGPDDSDDEPCESHPEFD